MTEARFCPHCGSQLAITGQRFCAACGGALPAAASPDASPDAGRTRPGAQVSPVASDAASAPLAETPIAHDALDWAELRAAAVAVLVPLTIWLAFSLVAAAMFADVFASTAGSWIGSLPVVSAGLGAIDAATYGLVASLFVGLGYHLGADVSASALGQTASATAALDVSAKALGSMLIIAVATALAARTAISRGSTASRALVLVRATLIAGAGSGAIFVVASVLGTLLGGSFRGEPSIGFGPFSVSGSVDGDLRGGPRVSDLLPVTFLLLLLAALAGAASATGLRCLVGERIAGRLAAIGSLLAAGFGGPLIAIAVLAVPYIIYAIIWWIMSGPAGATTGARLLPLLVAYTPNWIAEMAILATGTVVQSAGGSAVGGPIVLSIWTMPLWLITLGFVAQLLPGYLAGTILRGRDPRATPGRVVAVAVPVVLSLLFLAVLGLPSVQVTQSGISEALAQSVRFSFDPFQAVVVGGAATAAAALVGFQSGAPVWRILVRLIPALKPPGPAPMHFR